MKGKEFEIPDIYQIKNEDDGCEKIVHSIHTDKFQDAVTVMDYIIRTLRNAVFGNKSFRAEMTYNAEARSMVFVTKLPKDGEAGICPELSEEWWGNEPRQA